MWLCLSGTGLRRQETQRYESVGEMEYFDWLPAMSLYYNN